jgi:hypothetical protein
MDDANRQLAILAIERITIRHVEDEDCDDALDALEDLECGEWTPELLYLQGRARFGESEYEGAEISAQTAINARESAGGVAPQLWHGLAAASAQRAIQAATEQVVCRNERTSNSNIPVRVCTTRSQREAEAAAARDIMRDDTAVAVDTIRRFVLEPYASAITYGRCPRARSIMFLSSKGTIDATLKLSFRLYPSGFSRRLRS